MLLHLHSRTVVWDTTLCSCWPGNTELRWPIAGVVTHHLSSWLLAHLTIGVHPHAAVALRDVAGELQAFACNVQPHNCSRQGVTASDMQGNLLQRTSSTFQPWSHTSRGLAAQPDQRWPCALTYAVAILLHGKVLRLVLLGALQRWAWHVKSNDPHTYSRCGDVQSSAHLKPYLLIPTRMLVNEHSHITGC